MRRSLFHEAFGSTQDTAPEKNPAHCLVRSLLSVLEHTERLPVVMHERCVNSGHAKGERTVRLSFLARCLLFFLYPLPPQPLLTLPLPNIAPPTARPALARDTGCKC